MQRQTFPVGPLGCNCSVLTDERSHESVVIDPGGDAAQVLAALGNTTLKAILITHAHIDHLCGIDDVVRATQAPVMLHPDDAPLYDNVAAQALFLGLPEVPRLPTRRQNLTHLQNVSVGTDTIIALATPGHTPGSVCFHAPSDQVLFSGDTLFYRSVGRTDLWGGDHPALLRSIREQLLALPDETVVVPGHGGPTTIGDERKHNPFLR